LESFEKPDPELKSGFKKKYKLRTGIILILFFYYKNCRFSINVKTHRNTTTHVLGSAFENVKEK
jgi:hypothetical protein